MDEVLRMASLYPAECLGVANILGQIKPDYLANMVIFDNQLMVSSIIADGEYEDILK